MRTIVAMFSILLMTLGFFMVVYALIAPKKAKIETFEEFVARTRGAAL